MTGMFRSFRARIFWAILLVAAVAAGLSLWLTREWLEERQLDEARTGLLREARVAGELMLRGENDLEVLARVLDLPDLRLSLLDADGNVLAETGGVSPEGMDNHGDRPEVVQARSEGQGYSLRASGTLHKNFAYAGSKFGGIGLTQSFALELCAYNIKVNAVCPGNFLDGPLWSDPVRGLFVQYLEAGKVPGAKTVADVRRYYEAKVPMNRGCLPVDVARAVMYCVEQKYETGQAIPVTGGQVMLN